MCSFLLVSGPDSIVEAWGRLDPAAKAEAVAYAHSKGAVVLLSVGGETERPYGSSDAATYGRDAASWALLNKLDGVDFDLENFASGALRGVGGLSECVPTWAVPPATPPQGSPLVL